MFTDYCHSLCCADLNGTVVLVDLNSKLAARGEVLRLGQVALQAVVLHGVQVVLHPYQSPLVLVVLVLVAGPDLLKVGHDVVTSAHKEKITIMLRLSVSSPFNDHLNAGAGRLDDPADLVVAHLEHLLAVDAPDVIPLLETGVLSGAVSLQIENR